LKGQRMAMETTEFKSAIGKLAGRVEIVDLESR
jgi:hypothetical protein